jgi:lysine-N-methylase
MAAALTSLSACVEKHGLDVGPVTEALTHPLSIDDASLLPWVDALRGRAQRRVRDDAAWRSATDLARRATAWIDEAAASLVDPAFFAQVLRAPLGLRRSEAFYLRAVVHGHQLVGALSIADALRDRAVRVLVARSLRHVVAGVPAGERDTACVHPLALVEAVLRGHGLDAYAHDVAG